VTARSQIASLLSAWLTIDLFGKSRRSGERGTGTLTPAIFTQGFLSYLFAATAFLDVATVPFLAGTLALVAGFTALAVLGELGDQLGDDADRDLVLASPVSRSTFAIARGLHIAILLGFFAIGLALAPAILACWKTGHWWFAPIYLAVAFVVSAMVTGMIQLPVLVVEKLAGPAAAASLSALIRAILFGGGFLAILLGFRAMHQGPQVFPGGRALLELMPPYWYARALTGGPALWNLLALLAPVVVGLALWSIARLDAPRSAKRRSHRAGPIAVLARLLASGPRERGMTTFAVAMLARERSFRLRALPLLGLPAMAVVLGLRSNVDPGRLPFLLALMHNLPLAYLPFLIFFVPYSENARASWLVGVSVGNPVQAGRRGVALAFALLMIPLQGLLLIVDAAERGLAAAWPTTLAALGLAWITIPLLCRALQQPVFSRSPDELAPPGDLGGPVGVGIGVTLASIVLEPLAPPLRIVTALVLALAGGLVMFLPSRFRTP